METPDIKSIMLSLGRIEGCMGQLEKAQSRTTLALIGVIAAQIGVKVLGTPPLLDIVTALGIFGAVLIAGVLFFGWRWYRANIRLTKSGWALAIMMFAITVTQITVYFRDLGVLSANAIYCVRIFQNLTIAVFAWNIFSERHLYHDVEKDNEKECKPKK